MKKSANIDAMDERQVKERYRFGFHSFMIVCVELAVILVLAIFFYDWVSENITFYNMLMASLIIPLIYFNIATKISGVTNKTECFFSIVLALLYVVSLIVGLFTKNFTVSNLFFGALFLINGLIGLIYLILDKRAAEADYKEVHGEKDKSPS